MAGVADAGEGSGPIGAEDEEACETAAGVELDAPWVVTGSVTQLPL